MQLQQLLRWPMMLVIGAFITSMLFNLMQRLITPSNLELVEQLSVSSITLFQPPVVEQTEPEPPPTPTEQPQQQDNRFSTPVSAKLPTPSLENSFTMPEMNVDLGQFHVRANGTNWTAPLSQSAIGELTVGSDAKGFQEISAYSTRTPNIPEVAWKNKINGWVLLAFKLNQDGSTRDIRVLDSSPKGIFEEKAIAALTDWRFSVNNLPSQLDDVVLTQKLELFWQDFPQNRDWLD